MATVTDRRFYVFNGVISALALVFLGWLLLVHGGGGSGELRLSFMPAVNAVLNASAASLLVAGYLAIRGGNRALHMRLMVSAFACSALFLVGYVVYHYVHGDTVYRGAHRGLYLTVLASHVVLSMAVLPLALTTFYFAAKERFSAHRRIARITLPIWLYVSVTGVLIYFMLRGAS